MTRIERREWQRRRKLQIACRVASVLLALALILVCILLSTGGGKVDTPEPEAAVTGPVVMSEPQRPKQEAVDPLEADKIAPAEMVWGEVRGFSIAEQAATIWCVLNHCDGGDRFWADTVKGIMIQSYQFYDYDPGNPAGPDILVLVQDVLVRWVVGRGYVGSMGRVLPKEYLYFTGNGVHNYLIAEW